MKTKRADWPYCGVDPDKIREAEPVFDHTALQLFSHYVKERYEIHIQKDVLNSPRPWTTDRILQTFKFTNVRREHDPTTRWLITHIINHPDLTYRQKVLNIILYRGYNRIETAEVIGMPIAFGGSVPISAYTDKIDNYCLENPEYKPFTNAFMVSGFLRPLYAKFKTKSPSVVIKFVEFLDQDKDFFVNFTRCLNQSRVVRYLQTIEGISTFLAYQIFVDCTYLQDFPFSENEYTLCGPGARKGINCLFQDKDGMGYEECVFWMRNNWERMMAAVEDEDQRFIPSIHMSDLRPYDRTMNVMSLENCMCEFSKYYRTAMGTGQPRNHYTPRTRKEF